MVERLAGPVRVVEGLERDQQVTAGREHAAQLGERRRERVGRRMDDRVVRQHPGEARRGHVERAHVADVEPHARVRRTGDRHQLWREVDAERVDAALPQVAGHVPGPAADVGHLAAARLPDQVGEGLDQHVVQRLAGEGLADERGVGLGHVVVVGTDGRELLGGRHAPQPRREPSGLAPGN